MNIRGIWNAVAEFIYPSRAMCLGCGDRGGNTEPWLCDACRAELSGSRGAVLPDARMKGILACRSYAGPAGALVRNLKYHGVTALAEPIGRYMAERIREEGWKPDAVTCVPMHKKRRRRRGYNQSELLARVIARELGISCESFLTRTRNTPQQAKLDAEARRQNLKGAFAAHGAAGKHILLVDDVFTTGETARNCAEALYANGAGSVYFAAYATDND